MRELVDVEGNGNVGDYVVIAFGVSYNVRHLYPKWTLCTLITDMGASNV